MVAAAERRPINIPPETLNRARAQIFSIMAKGLKSGEVSLRKFFSDAWPIIEPGTPLQDVWYIDYIAEHLEAVEMGQILRLAISIHPRSAKSNLVTVAYPTWAWTKKAWRRFMFASYSQELAVDHSLRRRRIIESPWYQDNWGNMVHLMSDQNRKSVFENTARGAMIATSSAGTATGRGANVILFDDFINPREAESEVERKEKISAYENTFSSRLNNPKTDSMIVLAQRTHSDDLTGHVLKEGGWTHIELPVICEKRTKYFFPLSKAEYTREVGDILNPARHDASTLEKQKRSSGSRTFSAQWMCTPSSDEGNMVKRVWWKFYKEDPRVLYNQMQVKASSWDFAFKDLESGSFVVGLIGGRRGSQKFIFDEIRDHMDFVKTCSAVKTATSNWETQYNFYEDRANGPAIKSNLATKVHGLIPVEPLGSKEARMSAASPDIEAGDVLLPYPYDEKGAVRPDRQWVVDFIEELARFPEEPNDRGDAVSQLIIKLNSVLLFVEEKEDGGRIEGMANNDDDDFGELNIDEFEFR